MFIESGTLLERAIEIAEEEKEKQVKAAEYCLEQDRAKAQVYEFKQEVMEHEIKIQIIEHQKQIGLEENEILRLEKQ